MQGSINAADLVSALKAVSKAGEVRSSMPILAGVKLELNGSAHFTRTDLELSVTAIRPLERFGDGGAGSCILPFKLLQKIANKLKSKGRLDLELPGDSLQIAAGETQFQVTVAGSVDEFPSIPRVEANYVDIDAGRFSEAIGAVLYASSTDETRYNLNAVAFKAGNDGEPTDIVATDGHRLARARVFTGLESALRLRHAAGADPVMLIPRAAAAEILRQSKGVDLWTVRLSSRLVSFTADGVQITAKLIEGEYPNYQQVIPDAGSALFAYQVKAASLLESLATISQVSSERSQAVKVTLNGEIRLATENPDLGSASAPVDATVIRDGAGATIELGFNARYLADAVKALGSDAVTLSVADPLSPVTLGAPLDGGMERLAVVMPMRL